MIFEATTKYVRMSPAKAVAFARTLKGLPVERAMAMASAHNSKAAKLIAKTLKSALAGAQRQGEKTSGKFKVQSVLIEQGPALKRYWPRSRGMVSPIRRRTSHIRVILTDEVHTTESAH